MKFFKGKNVKIKKREHAFKGLASSYNVEILISFNLELHFNDSESVIKSKLIELLTQLKGFKFVTTLVLVFEKIESEDKTTHPAARFCSYVITTSLCTSKHCRRYISNGTPNDV